MFNEEEWVLAALKEWKEKGDAPDLSTLEGQEDFGSYIANRALDAREDAQGN